MRLVGSGSVTLKAVTIGAIVLLLMIPLMMLQGLVSERAERREAAYARVAEGWGGRAMTGGAVLIVPTERTHIVEGKERVVHDDLYVLPSTLNVDVTLTLQPEPRRVGIYEVPVYVADISISGAFHHERLRSRLTEPSVTFKLNQSRLLLPLYDVKSLREVQQARFARSELRFAPASRALLAGLQAPIDMTSLIGEASSTFEFQLRLAGTRDFALLPLGSTTSIDLQSNWPHPSFHGTFLPAAHNIEANGFDAHWQVLELNRPYAQVAYKTEMDSATVLSSAVSVGLYQPIDIYQRGERAVKYALLFVALTFLTFFAWEQVAGLRLHPLQYLLVGLALSTFYLLLLALSEHVAFSVAYAIAAAALVLLVGVYIAGAFSGAARGVAAGAAMTLVYGVLYVLVLSEDYALLLGAITLFVALSAVMLVTRKVDWYPVTQRPLGAD